VKLFSRPGVVIEKAGVEAMPEIISAKCLGCGNILKVPAALGGKKARCPQCTNTIVIPTAPSDTQFTEFISDADLPEVARDGEKVVREEGDAPIPGQEEDAAEDPSEIKRSKGGTSVRGRNVRPAAPAVQRSGPQPRVYAGGGTAARPAPSGGSNTGMIVGIALAVVALIVAAVFLMGGDHHGASPPKGTPKAPKEREKDAEKKKQGPQYTEAEQALIARLMDYTGTVSRGDIDQILRFYAYEPDDQRKMRIQVAQNLVDKKVAYENVQVKSINAAGGTITFGHSGGEKTLTWKQVNDVWLIAEAPSP
jgi:hypothetical protein